MPDAIDKAARGRAPSGRKEPGMEHGVLEGTPMRRDGSGRQEAVMHDGHMDAKVLRRAAEIVEQGWCREYEAVDAVGWQVDYADPKAVRWCFWGALDLATQEVVGMTESHAVLNRSTDAGARVIDVLGRDDFANWNDEPSRTADEVAAALREAADRCDGVSPERPQDVTPA